MMGFCYPFRIYHGFVEFSTVGSLWIRFWSSAGVPISFSTGSTALHGVRVF